MVERPLFSERRGTGGPVVVCLHGLAGSGRYWYRVAGRLAGARLQLQLVDLLGFGCSPWPDVPYTVDEHLAALDGWRAAAGLAHEPLVLVGHSLGALLALEWMACTPEVEGAVLIGLPVYEDSDEARRRLARLSLLHRLTLAAPPLGRAVCTVMCHSRPLWRVFAPLFVRGFPAEVARDGVLHTRRSFFGTLEHCILDLSFDHLRRRAVGLGLPLTFVHGTTDDTAPVANVRNLVTGLPRTRLLEIPQGGHDLPLSSADQVADAIRRFVSDSRLHTHTT